MANDEVKVVYKAIDEVSATLKGITKSMNGEANKWQQANKKVRSGFVNLNNDVNRSSQGMTGFNNVLRKMSGIGAVIGGVHLLSNTLRGSIESAMQSIEVTNLFNVALGDMSGKAEETVQSLTNLFGLDPTNLRSSMGTYAMLAKSMGMTSNQAEVLSTNTTRLAIDLASLNNVSVAQAMQDLRSGLVGQSETVYKYGIDVTEAGIKSEALAQGISKSVREMSQGEKMALRYAVMLRQTSLAQGDFARTINQPANQLRILQERIVTLSRSIGNIFIPMLSSILPYINAFIMWLTELANAIAKFFGFSVKEKAGTGTANALSSMKDSAKDATGAVGGTNKALGGTAKALKKVKNALLGIDEINTLQTKVDDAGAGGGGGGAGGVGGGLGSILDGIELPSLDDLASNITDISKQLLEKWRPFFEWLLDTAITIGVILLAWKLAPAILNLLTMPAGSLFGGIGKILAINAPLLAIAGTVAVMVLRFIDLVRKSEKFRRGLETIWGWVKDIASAIYTGIVQVMDDLANNDWGIPKSWTDAFKGLDMDASDLLITLGAIALLFTPFGGFGIALLVFEGISLAVRGIGALFSPAIESMKTFTDGMSEATKAKVDPFIKSLQDLELTFKDLTFRGVIIDDTVLADTETKLKGITTMILNELDADKNQALSTLEPLKKALGDEAFNKIMEANKTYYDNATKSVTDGEAEINAIIKKAKDEGRSITQEEYDKINKIQENMQDVGLKHMTDSETEYLKVTNRLRDNSVKINVEQSSEIIKNAIKTRDETVASAENQYRDIEVEAQRMLDVGAISEEQYNSIMDSAKTAKEDTIKKANEQYSEIDRLTREKLGSTASYIDTTTGEIKTKWAIGMENLKTMWSKGWGDIKKWFNDNVLYLFQPSYWEGVMNDLYKGINKVLDKIKTAFTSWTATIKMPHISWSSEGGYSVKGWAKQALEVLGLPTTIPKLSVSWYANGGFPEAGELFMAREAGAEMVGSIGGRTAVANNDQIVEAVSRGVYTAMVSALSTKSGGRSGDVVIEIGGTEFGRIAIDAINGVTKQEGKLLLNT